MSRLPRATRTTRLDSTGGRARIVVTKDGPYRVEGGVPLLRTAIVADRARRAGRLGRGARRSRRRARSTSSAAAATRRASRSATTSCRDERIPFDGTETADRGPIADRREAWEGEEDHVLYDDLSLCTHAGLLPQRADRRLGDGRGGRRPRACGPSSRAMVDPVSLGPAGVRDPARSPSRSSRRSSPRSGVEPNASLLGPRRDPRRLRGRDARTRCATARPCAGAGSRATSRSATGRTRRTGSTTPQCRD